MAGTDRPVGLLQWDRGSEAGERRICDNAAFTELELQWGHSPEAVERLKVLTTPKNVVIA